MAREAVEMVVESVTQETPEVKSVRLKWPSGYDVAFKTGQFITIHWPETPNYKRAYSLSSCALDRGYYEVTVKREGKMGTRLVDWSEVGNRLMVLPPTGVFLPMYEPHKHLICMAGGSGVTPFRGFVREAQLRQLSTRITVLYSVRTPDEIIFRKDFEALEAAYPHFRFLVTCTRVPENDGNWTGRRGRITLDWVREQVGDLAHSVFYACGSNEMVDGLKAMVLNELKAEKAQMKVEKWG